MSSKNSKKRLSILALSLVLVVVLVIGTMSVFTDRVNQTVTFSVASFSKDGYTLERTAPDGYFVAGESVETTVTERNGSAGSMNAMLFMSASWSSPDPASKPWGNANAQDNAVLTVDGSSVAYTVNTDGTISFTLPENTIGFYYIGSDN